MKFKTFMYLLRRPVTYTSQSNSSYCWYDEPREWAHLVTGMLYSLLWVQTVKQAGSKEAQWTVDYTYQYEMARIAAQNGVKKYGLVSSLGANPKSVLLYVRRTIRRCYFKLPFGSDCYCSSNYIDSKEPKLVERISCAVLLLSNKARAIMSQEPVRSG